THNSRARPSHIEAVPFAEASTHAVRADRVGDRPLLAPSRDALRLPGLRRAHDRDRGLQGGRQLPQLRQLRAESRYRLAQARTPRRPPHIPADPLCSSRWGGDPQPTASPTPRTAAAPVNESSEIVRRSRDSIRLVIATAVTASAAERAVAAPRAWIDGIVAAATTMNANAPSVHAAASGRTPRRRLASSEPSPH